MKILVSVQRLLLLLAISSSLLADARDGYKEIVCTYKPIVQKAEHCSHPHIPGPTSRAVPKNMVSSTNWSGYVAAGNLNNPANNTVTAVSGSWIVPAVSISNNNTYCAYWVGIDGYTSSTVEQIGTSHNSINGVANHYAWFEMYPGGSYVINGFPLAPGHVISATVQYTNNGVFVLRLYNDTAQVVTTIPTMYTTSLTAKRSCAEWVVEAPYLNGILPLTNFTTAYLWGCTAMINGVLAPIVNGSWQNSGLEMITNSGAPKAIPSSPLIDNGSFFVTWQHQ